MISRAIVLFMLGTGIVAALPSRASAQTTDHPVGITMGYPASIGLIWHISDRVAVRPELAFSHLHGESESSSGFDAESDTWTLAVGASALIYVGEWDRLRAYVSPRYSYARAKSSSDSSSPFDVSDAKTTTHSFAGYFGAQYALSDRFSAFGEVGFGLTDQTGTTSLGTRLTSTIWSTRTGVGVIFYF
jgi:hypothetical protein